MPQRIQQRRTKGWRLPAGAISVSRPGRWGNPFRWNYWVEEAGWSPEKARAFVVNQFRACLSGRDAPENPDYEERINWMRAHLADLRGKNLACFCPLDKPCHADVLLELANR